MGRPSSRNPTEHELEILKIVWREGVVTTRQVQDALSEHRGLTVSSINTVLSIMVRKQYLNRAKAGGAYVYTPRVSKDGTIRKIVRDLVSRVFGGSSFSFMLNLIKEEDLDPDKLKLLRSLIDKKSKR